MRAAILYELNKPLVVEDLTAADPGYGQVRVRIAASGVCHTQISEARGCRGPDKFLPHTMGHEGAGVVEAIGPGVTRVKAGDHVILTWIKGPGINAAPPAYAVGGRKINAGQITTFQDEAVVAENRVVPIRKDMPLDKAALIGCAVATGAGAVFNTARPKPGSAVLVFGAGGIGLCAIQAAALTNAGKVIAVDIHDHKLALARAFGATHVVNAKTQDVVPAVLELTGGRGADVAIEAAGIRETMEQAFQSIRADGGLAILIGNLAKGMPISIDPFMLICGKQIVGSWGGATDPAQDFPRYVDLYMTGKLKLDELITHRFRLDDVNAALEAVEQGKAGRAIIEFPGR
ncbi:MAG: hypothetical protein A3G34_11690 [Candidatus Lindowbacteria bacterium RIFCSPLOWO2_12_FULL_62_27]|nr:MAG: hypothetical protein A3I06_02255 [Candidatus Lindowbacteria bacterium RIFCSPLOWO2_02_FULL_62_12]OGH60914.1 MAG: hypothetical protein A3G34_11690 [Candidatus Lindowbacteria bacterium RIFCSPLOWO2_12_FULL_62_27]